MAGAFKPWRVRRTICMAGSPQCPGEADEPMSSRWSIGSMMSTAYRNPRSDSLMELLNADEFKQSVPSVVLNAFHSIRLAGNKAAHGESVARFNAPDLLEDAFHLGCWFFIINGGQKSDCPTYQRT